MTSFIVLILLHSVMAQSVINKCCDPVKETQCTEWEHMTNRYDYRSTPIHSLKGRILDPFEAPVKNVLIEVYKLVTIDKKYGYERWNLDIKCKERIIACVTRQTGEFAFDLPSGIYEIRASKPDWNVTTILISIDKEKGEIKNTNIHFEVAT